MFFQPQCLRDVRGHSPILSDLMILPVTVPMIFISPFSGRLISRFGARRLMSAGMLCGVAGLQVMYRIQADSPYALLLVRYLLFGIASGVLAMDRVLAGAVALAATGAVAYVRDPDEPPQGEPQHHMHHRRFHL
jgi:MFS transporter, DHA2 family, methylenomycin A resistance protein